MAIILHTKDQNLDWARWNLYPDQFVPEKQKETNDWIKSNMDYFANVAYSQFIKGRDTFVNNYNLVKGILRKEDFYLDDDNSEMRSFTETLVKDVELPNYVRHYPILNPPLNTMLGELAKRPDAVRVKAFDEDSKNEELQFKTQALQQFIMENAKQKITIMMSQEGQQPDPEELQKAIQEHVQEYITDYTSTAEKWANHVLEACKIELNLKEVSEDCFRDLLICSREFWHIYERADKLGFSVENLNPKNVWFLTLPDKKYLKEAFAAGMVHVMELSEIIERFDLDKKEIDHLRDGVRELSLFSPRESNFESSQTSGWDSIKYDTYSPLIVQQRLLIESELKENVDPLNDFLGLSSNVNTFGNKYVVVQAYWCSKKKVGKLTYTDEQGEQQTTLVDESYKKIPTEISIEWNYINQWWKGFKIGSDVYRVEAFKLLDYCPIMGVVHEIKNVDEPRSLIDLLKPYQIIYNVCLNQLYKLLEKEVGNVYLTSIRHIPIPKDGDGQDAIDIWEEDARKRGVVFIDDSPENLKSPSNFNMFKNVDLTRTSEIQSRYQLAMQIKTEAWELVGITRERAGAVAATQTATGTNTALSQSYAQTEPYFAQHEYVMNDVFQAILDTAQYIETQKPYSTISYVNTEGEGAFIKVNSEDIKMKDLKVFATSRPEDQKVFQELRQLSQAMLQNGATPYDVSVLYTTNSVRQMKQIFKSIKDKIEKMQEQQQQNEQQQMQQEQQQFEAQQQAEAQQHQADQAFEAEQNELDRESKERIAANSERSKLANTRLSISNDASKFDASNYAQDSQNADRDHLLKQQAQQEQQRKNVADNQLAREKLAAERERTRAQIAMKKMESAKKKAEAKKKK